MAPTLSLLRSLECVRRLPAARLLLDTDQQIVSFAEDADGELYFLDFRAGTIYRIENAP